VTAVESAATQANKQLERRGPRSFNKSTAEVVGSNNADMASTNGNHVVAHQLPPEIRLRIYELVLTLPHNDPSTRPNHGLPYVFKKSGPRCEDLSLLCVSRQTFLEAFHVFYRCNKLHFASADVLYKFLKNVGFARRQQITSIAFGWLWIDYHAKEAFRLLKTCSNLKYIEIIVNSKTYPKWTMSDEAALKEVRGMEMVKFRAHWPWKPSCRRRYADDGIVREMRQAMTRPRLKQYAADPTKLIDPFKQGRERFPKSEVTLLKDDFKQALEDANDLEDPKEFTENCTIQITTSASRNLIPQFLQDKRDAGGRS